MNYLWIILKIYIELPYKNLPFIRSQNFSYLTCYIYKIAHSTLVAFSNSFSIGYFTAYNQIY